MRHDHLLDEGPRTVVAKIQREGGNHGLMAVPTVVDRQYLKAQTAKGRGEAT